MSQTLVGEHITALGLRIERVCVGSVHPRLDLRVLGPTGIGGSNSTPPSSALTPNITPFTCNKHDEQAKLEHADRTAVFRMYPCAALLSRHPPCLLSVSVCLSVCLPDCFSFCVSISVSLCLSLCLSVSLTCRAFFGCCCSACCCCCCCCRC